MILIFTELLSSTGLGHFSRCSALYDACKEKGEAVHFVLHTDESGDFYKNDSIISVNWKDSEICKEYLDKYKPDLSIVDSYLADLNVYELIQGRSKQLVCIDDDSRIVYPKGSILFNPGIHGKSIPYDPEWNRIISGVEYVLLRKPFREEVKERETSENVNRILITTGGDDRWNLTPVLLRKARNAFPDAKINIVMGPSFNNKNDIIKISDSMMECIDRPDAQNMCNLMLESDLAISAGGQTMYELARCGVPMIVFEVAANQRGNMEGFVKAKAAYSVGDASDDGFSDKLEFTLGEFISSKVRRTQSLNGKELVDGKGAVRALELFLG